MEKLNARFLNGVPSNTDSSAVPALMAEFGLAPATARRLAERGCSPETAQKLWRTGLRAMVDPARTDD